jgi:hypothetical protein
MAVKRGRWRACLQAPMTRIILLSAPVHLQPLAFSIQTITIHVLGDVPSPPLAGWIHDHILHQGDKVRFHSLNLAFLLHPLQDPKLKIQRKQRISEGRYPQCMLHRPSGASQQSESSAVLSATV